MSQMDPLSTEQFPGCIPAGRRPIRVRVYATKADPEPFIDVQGTVRAASQAAAKGQVTRLLKRYGRLYPSAAAIEVDLLNTTTTTTEGE